MEDAFFRKLDADLIAELRRRETELTQEKVLSELSGITNKAILHQLITKGIHAEELAAFLLIPILEVVWADGNVQPAERDVVFHAVEEAGIRKSQSRLPAHAAVVGTAPRAGVDETLDRLHPGADGSADARCPGMHSENRARTRPRRCRSRWGISGIRMRIRAGRRGVIRLGRCLRNPR